MRRIGLQFPPICIVYVFLVFGSCSPFACMCLSVITGFQFVYFFIYPLLCDKYIRDISFRSLALTSDDI